jgi:hypothetical protein
MKPSNTPAASTIKAAITIPIRIRRAGMIFSKKVDFPVLNDLCLEEEGLFKLTLTKPDSATPYCQILFHGGQCKFV